MSRARGVAITPAVLLAVAAAALFFWKLGDTGLVNGDEGFYHTVARNMLASGDYTRLEFTGEHRVYDTFMNAPLQYWARAGLIAALGDNYWSMRGLSALFAVLSIVATYWLGASIGGTRAGVLAALAQMTTFQFVYLHSARTGELEPVVCFVLTFTVLLFLRSIERGRGWLGHHLCLIALVNIKAPLVLIPVAAELVFLLVTPVARRRLPGWLAFGAAILPVALAWHIGQFVALGSDAWNVIAKMSGQASGEELQRERGAFANAGFYAETMLHGAYPYVFAFPVALLGMLAARLSRRRKRRALHTALMAAAVLLFFLLVAKSYPWYVIPAYPFLCVLAGCWLSRFVGARSRVGFLIGAAIIAGLCAATWPQRVNPFEDTAMKLDTTVHWRSWFGLSPTVTAALAVASGLCVLVISNRVSQRSRRALGAWALTLALLMIGGYRVLDALRATSFVSPTEQVYLDLQLRRAAGEPIEFPVDLPQLGNTRVRYFFGDDYEIVRATGQPGVVYQLIGAGKTPHDPPRQRYLTKVPKRRRGRASPPETDDEARPDRRDNRP